MQEDDGLNEVVAGGDGQAHEDGQPETRRVQELRLEARTAFILVPAPFVDGHHLERDEDEVIEERAVVVALQRELDAE